MKLQIKHKTKIPLLQQSLLQQVLLPHETPHPMQMKIMILIINITFKKTQRYLGEPYERSAHVC